MHHTPRLESADPARNATRERRLSSTCSGWPLNETIRGGSATVRDCWLKHGRVPSSTVEGLDRRRPYLRLTVSRELVVEKSRQTTPGRSE